MASVLWAHSASLLCLFFKKKKHLWFEITLFAHLFMAYLSCCHVNSMKVRILSYFLLDHQYWDTVGHMCPTLPPGFMPRPQSRVEGQQNKYLSHRDNLVPTQAEAGVVLDWGDQEFLHPIPGRCGNRGTTLHYPIGLHLQNTNSRRKWWRSLRQQSWSINPKHKTLLCQALHDCAGHIHEAGLHGRA